MSTTGATIKQAGELRIARLESLRGLGSIGVVAAHAWVVARGSAGLAVTDTYPHRLLLSGSFGLWLFFALAGYLLYWPFAQRDFGHGGGVALRQYARNRALRIFPVYFAALVVAFALEGGGSPREWLTFALFLENFDPRTVGTVVGPMWSLVVELHFYTLLPFLAAGIALVARRRRRVAAVLLGLLLVLGTAVRWFTVEGVVDASKIDIRWQYSLPANIAFLAAGMLLALLRTAWQERPPAWLAGPLGRADVWMLASVPVWLTIVLDYRLVGLSAVAAALMVGACVLPLRPGRVVGLLDFRPLAALGVMSYSLYLIHFPLMLALVDHVDGSLQLFALAAVIAVPLAALSYRVVERPFLSLRRVWSPDAAQRATAASPPAPMPKT